VSKLDTWNENLPEGMVLLSDTSGTSSSPSNPCGWVLGRGLDLTTPAGRATWQERMRAQAAKCVAACKAVGGRSVIFWDWDHGTPVATPGYHTTSLVGDPVNPAREWHGAYGEPFAFADEFFDTLGAAGVGVGMCLRHTWVPPGAPCHVQAASVVDLLQCRARFAYDRWGVKTFYWDSNVAFSLVEDPKNPRNVIPASYSGYVAGMADCLMVFEHYTAAHANYGLLWYEPVGADPVTPALAGGWPPYTRFLVRINAVPPSRDGELAAAVKAGHKLIFDGGNPANSLNARVASVYVKATA
jgi:hypothetical protein